jgi:hypothetical protein
MRSHHFVKLALGAGFLLLTMCKQTTNGARVKSDDDDSTETAPENSGVSADQMSYDEMVTHLKEHFAYDEAHPTADDSSSTTTAASTTQPEQTPPSVTLTSAD